MAPMIVSIVGALVAIIIIVFIHELGHFIAARALNVKILKFSIGFGPALWSYTSPKTGTVYALCLIPLGGYLKMYGEQQSDAAELLWADLAYDRKPVWARMIISLAGPLANIFLAVILFSVVMLLGVTYVKPVVGSVIPHSMAAQAGIIKGDQLTQIGKQKIYGWEQVITAVLPHVGDRTPLLMVTRLGSQLTQHYVDVSDWRIKSREPDIINALGFVPYYPPVPPIIGEVVSGSPAALAGMHDGDRILSINGKMITDWSQVLPAIRLLPKKQTMLEVQRGTQKIIFSVHLAGHLGVRVKLPSLPDTMIQVMHYGFSAAIQEGLLHTWDLLVLNLDILKQMIMGHVSLATLSGPISVFKTAGEASQAGLSIYLSFIGFISVALGFVNLLPIPVLDGGHVFFQLIELARRRPLSLQYQLVGAKIGLFLLVCLMLQATINDVLRLL